MIHLTEWNTGVRVYRNYQCTACANELEATVNSERKKSGSDLKGAENVN